MIGYLLTLGSTDDDEFLNPWTPLGPVQSIKKVTASPVTVWQELWQSWNVECSEHHWVLLHSSLVSDTEQRRIVVNPGIYEYKNLNI